ncbi:MAG: helix-turn-helix transcriptional regulator [Flavisolibacter sp.]|nr:helix-turn-helix transcriptional regulator [Flavisolibacter sp.]
MEFKQEALVEREIEIAAFLLQDFSFKRIANHLKVNEKIIKAHIRNMMQKLNAENIEDLIQSIKAKQQKK